MVVSNKLSEILSLYDVAVNTQDKTNGIDTFVEIADKHDADLKLTVQYVRDNIYCVYFLNNQYFEEGTEVLYDVLQLILAGNYVVRKEGIFKRTLRLDIQSNHRAIIPERIDSSRDFEEIYQTLPKPFTKK